MFKWRRRVTPHSKPSPTPEPIVEKEKAKPIPYNLISAQLRILDRSSPLTIIDAGAHHGHTTEQYLENFPQARVIGIEPDRENFAKAAARVQRFGDRVELIRAGLAEADGTADLHRNAYDMTHSLLELGEMRYYDEPFDALPPEKIETVTVDSLCAKRKLEAVDILKMDIQGAELRALQGAKSMLSRGAIRLVVAEINFVPLYKELPTFWDVAEHLRGYGYALQGIYELRHQPQQPAILCWADAIFVAPQMLVLSEKPRIQPRIDEPLETVGGHSLPAEFLGNVSLSSDATMRSGQMQANDSKPGLSSIMDVVIDTSPIPYRYAITIDPDPNAVRKLKSGGLVTLEVALEVMAGKLGIVWTGEDYYPMESTERYVSAMPGIQRVLVSAPSEQIHHLAIRNVAGESTVTSFRLLGLRAKASR